MLDEISSISITDVNANRSRYYYAGGDSGSHLEYWRIVNSANQYQVPTQTLPCMCSREQHYYINQNGEVIKINICCAERLIPTINRSKTCSLCRKPHNSNTDNYCNKCRYENVLQFGMHKGMLFTED